MAKNLPEFLGTYKAMVLGTIVEPSNKAKIPTMKIRVCLLEYYSEADDEWLSVEEEHWVMTAFLTLYSKEKEPSLNHQQVCKVFDWDGCGFAPLCDPALEGKTIQVRIKDSENEKFPLEISWIDTEDADPKGGFKKLTADEIKALDSEFADFLDKKPAKAATTKGKTATSAKSKLAAAKAKAAAAKAKVETPEPEDGGEEPEAEVEPEPEMTPEQKKKALLAKSQRLRKKQESDREAAASAGPPTKAPKKAKGRVIEAGEDMPEDFNKKDAWYTVTALRDDACDDDMQAAEWQAAIEDIAPDGDEDNLDAEGWWAVKQRVLENIGKS